MSKAEKNEDAFPDANRYAGKVVNMADRPMNEVSLKRMQKEYTTIFDAFLAGVEWARRSENLERK